MNHVRCDTNINFSHLTLRHICESFGNLRTRYSRSVARFYISVFATFCFMNETQISKILKLSSLVVTLIIKYDGWLNNVWHILRGSRCWRVLSTVDPSLQVFQCFSNFFEGWTLICF